MKKLFFLFVLIGITYSCSKPFTYKYQNEPQTIDCPSIDTKLIHEALYSFKNDISKYYLREFQEKDYLNFPSSYNQYIYRGAKGDLKFKEIASTHTLKIVGELKKEKNLFVKIKGKSNLNYQNGFVKCLINNIENEEMRNKIINLIDVDYLSPEVMAENYRKTTRVAEIDSNYLMFIALDTYFLRLIDLEIPETN